MTTSGYYIVSRQSSAFANAEKGPRLRLVGDRLIRLPQSAVHAELPSFVVTAVVPAPVQEQGQGALSSPQRVVSASLAPAEGVARSTAPARRSLGLLELVHRRLVDVWGWQNLQLDTTQRCLGPAEAAAQEARWRLVRLRLLPELGKSSLDCEPGKPGGARRLGLPNCFSGPEEAFFQNISILVQ